MSDNIEIHEGTLLASRYVVVDFLGEGCFGKVAMCVNTANNSKVAIKITKDEPCLIQRALEEIKILKQLRTLDPDRSNMVRWNGSFFHQIYICLEFELLDQSLLDYRLQRPSQCLSINEVCPILHQLTTALLHLEALRIIHADLKPENIMVVDRRQQPLRVKLIDFGLARHAVDAVQGSCVQSLWYRAPEVLLGLAFTEPIDMWSLGLIAAELALGYPLFPAEHEYDMIKFIVDTIGQPPDYQLTCGKYTAHFFCTTSCNNHITLRLMSPEEFANQNDHHFRDTRYFPLSSLDALGRSLSWMNFSNEVEERHLQNFVDLVKKMIMVDKHERIIPLNVLRHPFFSVEQHTDHS